jgi:hypothetical protein
MISFKRWLELFGQGIEPPIEQPSKVNNGGFPRYSLDKSDLPPTPENRKMCKDGKKKKR